MTGILAALAGHLAQRQRPRPHRKAKPVRPSRADELWYQAQLLALVDSVRRTAEREVLAVLNTVASADSAQTAQDRGPYTSALINEVLQVLRRKYSQADLAQALADAATRRVMRSADAGLQTSIQRAMGIDISGFLTRDTGMKAVMDAATKANVGLIKSIPDKYFDLLQDRLKAGVQAGMRHEALAKMVQDIGGVSAKRAKLIARDQVSKMNGAMTMLRQTALGISRYTWQSAGDERVRDEHAGNDGREFAWDDPPANTGHPGEDVACRCVAIPVVSFGGEDEDEDEESGGGLTLGRAVGIGTAALAISRYFGAWSDAGKELSTANLDTTDHHRWQPRSAA